MELGGTSCVITEFEPMTQPSPIVTPLNTDTFSPIQTLGPITIGDDVRGLSLGGVAGLDEFSGP